MLCTVQIILLMYSQQDKNWFVLIDVTSVGIFDSEEAIKFSDVVLKKFDSFNDLFQIFYSKISLIEAFGLVQFAKTLFDIDHNTFKGDVKAEKKIIVYRLQFMFIWLFGMGFPRIVSCSTLIHWTYYDFICYPIQLPVL